MPPGKLAAPLVSMVLTEPPPPEPSMMRTMGRRKSCAISSAIKGFAEIDASAEPPRTVKSSPTTTNVRPSTRARPNTQFAGVTVLSSPDGWYSPMPETAPISWKLPLSISLSMRSRTVSRPWSCCRLTLSTPPISRAKASRRASSSSSGFQFIHSLRIDRLVIVMHGHCDRFARDAIVEDIAFSAFEQAAKRAAELEHQRRDFGMQTLLIIHRGQKADRDDHEGLVLRRPDRHREPVDVRTPQAAGHDIAMIAQRLPVGFDTRPQDLGRLRGFPLHLRNEGIADFRRQRRSVGRARG